MSNPNEIEDFPGGIKVREGGDIPVFLKLTYVGFTIYAVVYFFMYLSGDGAPLVKVFNSLSGHGP